MTITDKISSIRETMGGSYTKPSPEKLRKFIDNLESSSVAKDYLVNKRGLAEETIKHFNLGYDEERNAIAIPVYKRGELINIKYRLLDPKGDIRYTQERGAEVWLFNEDGISQGLKKGGVLVVEGEHDLMSAWQAGFKNVISPASGKDSYGIWLELLDNIPKVYIAYDNDKPGRTASLKMAERVGIDKCMEVFYPEGIKDANEYFSRFDKKDFRELLKSARPYYRYKFVGVSDVLEQLQKNTDNTLKIDLIPYVEFEEDWIVVVSGDSNAGKCHGRGTKILMHDGNIKKVEDIVVGDVLMGVNNEKRTVLSLAKGRGKMYKIWERGEFYTGNEAHVLSLVSRRQNKKTKEQKSVYREISIKDYLSLNPKYRRFLRGWKTSVDFSSKEVKISPYLLGLWLGDGTTSKTQITSADKEVIDYCKEYAIKNGYHLNIYKQENNKAISFDFAVNRGEKNQLRRDLIHYNLLGHKHIPFEYKINTQEVRLAVLAGIIDTDGYLSKTSRGEYYEIAQKSDELTDDILFLARSLGFRATKTIKYVDGAPYNRILIVGDLSRLPLLVERRKSTFVPSKQYLTSKIDIEPIGIDDYFGFELDGDGLYLLDSFTVTHNTSFVLNVANELAEKKIPTLVMPYERGIKTVGKRFLQVRYNLANEDFHYLESDDWRRMVDGSVNLPLYFSTPHISETRELIGKAKRIFDVKVIIIDHLDYLVRKSQSDKNSETSNFLQEYKAIAQEYGIIFILVHHINKPGVKSQKPRRPRKEDLKGTSALYQDPEAVIMLYPPTPETLEVIIEKNKGKMGFKTFDFNPNTGVVSSGKEKVKTIEDTSDPYLESLWEQS